MLQDSFTAITTAKRYGRKESTTEIAMLTQLGLGSNEFHG